MSKHVSFPASHLSSFDLGNRIQVITADGAKVIDTLVGISATLRNGQKRLLLSFQNVTAVAGEYAHGAGAFELNPEQFVRRIDA